MPWPEFKRELQQKGTLSGRPIMHAIQHLDTHEIEVTNDVGQMRRFTREHLEQMYEIRHL